MKAKVRHQTVAFYVFFLVGASAFPVEASDWEFSGFADARTGLRLQDDAHQDDQTLNELRVQLSQFLYHDQFTLTVRSDLLLDGVMEEYDQLDLERGDGAFDLRELNVLFTPVDWADVKVGRQILTWGTGDLLFINDLFPKDWNSFLSGRDEEYLKAPSDAIFTSFFPSFGSIDVAYMPRMDADRYIDGRRVSYWNPGLQRLAGEDAVVDADERDSWFQDHEISARFYRPVFNYEGALYAYHGFWKSPSGSDAVTGNAYFPGLNVYGASLRGALGEGLLNLETGYYDSREDRSGDDPLVPNSELRFLVGYEREAAQDLTASVQYYVEWMQDYDRYMTGASAATARDEFRHVLTLRLTQRLMNQNLTLGLFTFYSPSDNDAYLRPNATYKVSDNWTATAAGGLFFGEDDHTFYGQFEQNSNVSLSLRYSY